MKMLEAPAKEETLKNKSIFIYSTHDLNPNKLTEDDFMIRTTDDGEIRFHIL